jgi:hypothetical protein
MLLLLLLLLLPPLRPGARGAAERTRGTGGRKRVEAVGHQAQRVGVVRREGQVPLAGPGRARRHGVHAQPRLGHLLAQPELRVAQQPVLRRLESLEARGLVVVHDEYFL